MNIEPVQPNGLKDRPVGSVGGARALWFGLGTGSGMIGNGGPVGPPGRHREPEYRWGLPVTRQ
jgi:hypothetical protein